MHEIGKQSMRKAGTFSHTVDNEYYSVSPPLEGISYSVAKLNKVINPQLRLILLRAAVAS